MDSTKGNAVSLLAREEMRALLENKERPKFSRPDLDRNGMIEEALVSRWLGGEETAKGRLPGAVDFKQFVVPIKALLRDVRLEPPFEGRRAFESGPVEERDVDNSADHEDPIVNHTEIGIDLDASTTLPFGNQEEWSGPLVGQRTGKSAMSARANLAILERGDDAIDRDGGSGDCLRVPSSSGDEREQAS